MPPAPAGPFDQLGSEAGLLLGLTAIFLVLLAVHLADAARRRRRVAALRRAGDYGPRSRRVRALVARAATLTPAEAGRLADARDRALRRDPAANRLPAAARRARDRAFANERDVVALAAAVAAREAVAGALGRGDPATADAAEAAAEAAGALVARSRIPDDEFRMLTRAWRTAIGPFADEPVPSVSPGSPTGSRPVDVSAGPSPAPADVPPEPPAEKPERLPPSAGPSAT